MFGTITQNYECSKALLIGWLRRIEFEWLNLIGFQIDTVKPYAEQMAGSHRNRTVKDTVVRRNEIDLAFRAPQPALELRPLRIRVPADAGRDLVSPWRHDIAPCPFLHSFCHSCLL